MSIRFNREFDSIEIHESDLQREKHDDPRISTFRAISIHLSDQNENPNDSIRGNREFDSNEIDESDLQNEKHDELRMSISEEIGIFDHDKKWQINP
jgi:hypothetical protein